jgi:hypothetical protein
MSEETSESIVCVKCTNVLDRTTIGGIEVDHCPSCGGLWLDRGELEKLGTRSQTELDDLRELLGVNPKIPPVPDETTVHCPACEGKLKELRFGNILIDFCDTCRGLWLDKGEFDAALKHIKEHGKSVESLLVLAGQLAG